jgi:two-component system, chemotaxis family, response regulator Rcp1
MNIGKQIEVLLVEDDPGDVDLTLEVMNMSKLKVNINVVGDGVECLNYLRNAAGYEDKLKPDMILLDLNMPRKDGRETLHEIKNDPALKMLPVVVLTTSDANEDIVRSYTTGANCYITKPVGLDQFTKIVSSIENFWFTIVKLPPKS